jgi:hypothetical protein
MMAVSCLACLGQAENDVVQLNAGPHLAAGDVEIVTAIEKWALEGAASEFRSPLRPGGAFSPRNWAQPDNAARFRALDLSVPMPLRSLRGDTLSGELSFGAAAEATGLGLDIEVAPRARIEEATGGASVARAGAELRFGRNFWSGDGRGAPAWYMFVGADNEALFWDLGDRRGFDSVGVQEQVTVGDLQAGLAWSGRPGAQMSFGLVERSMEYNDIAGDRDVRSRERFAAFSYTLRR